MSRGTCRYPSCDNPTREDAGAFSSRFCSTPCELKYEHVRADARDAAREEGRL